MEKLYALLEDIRPDVDFRNVNTLVTDGYIDSFDIVTIIASIEDEFSVEIPVDSMLPENFDSVESMMRLINASKGV
ncbi:MAG: acyl carrier protein [Phascolarctobacterium sp.]|uniref:acyl carrier protein n=1 Tax=Phascolarctobacterium sp. TaxID=2049039 RepID=UPI0026DB0944|nr:acyl carrier protein [Phascolarctobacterium sp.]MDO4922014.1 acyl carrier protein [Phascolarctobacterium sp.]